MILNSASAAYVGGQPVSAMWLNGVRVWAPPDPGPSWDFTDLFNRSAIGSAWTGSGGELFSGHLRKANSASGSSDYWTTQTFGSDDLTVEAVLGPVQNNTIVFSVLLGSTAQYIYIECNNAATRIGEYNGSTWRTVATGPGQAWTAGNRITVERVGAAVRVLRNGTQIMQAGTSVARGTAYRKVALSTRIVRSGLPWSYNYSRGGTFDEVRIRA